MLKVKVTWLFCVFFCVHDAAATRGQYLALNKAWWSCYYYFYARQQALQSAY